ncbi:hypothetical protein GOV08_01455 [Candidatus Woesearchaeota archaeon]|nr:hypothetical protein [Candidatus Woesearchaeota archaeon]
MKTITSALELYFLIKEMQFLVGGKVDKVYNDKKKLLLQLHVTSKGKNLLYVSAPDYFYLTSKKPEFPSLPGGFTAFLRKYLNNTRVKRISQIGFERIVEIEFESKENSYIMILELFAKGNIILCKSDYTIMSAIETKNWSVRTIRGGIKYEFPQKKRNILKMSQKELKDAINNSGKDSVVKALAIELCLGGVYGEELLLRAGVNKDKGKIDDKEAKKILKAFEDIILKKQKAVISDDTPFPFNPKMVEGKEFDSFNKAIDSIVTPKIVLLKAKEAVSKHDKKIEKAKEIIKRQEKQIKEMRNAHDKHQRTGEIIYEKYTEIKDILKQLTTIRKKYSWKEIKEKLKGHKIIKEINEKDSKIIIKL